MKTSRLGKVVEIPIHACLKFALEEHRKSAEGDYLFPQERNLYLKNPSNLTSEFQAFFKECGIVTRVKKDDEQRKRAMVTIGFHSLRHSFVTLCAKAGAPIHVIQKLVGHGSPMLTTDTYNHLDDSQKRSAIDPLPRLEISKTASPPQSDSNDENPT